METLERIRSSGLLPVVEMPDAALARSLGEALVDAGLPCAEITFRTSVAAEAIAVLHRHCPELLLGAGTVRTVEQAEEALGAGASFLVSPGFNHRVVDYAAEHDVVILPGVCTPTEIEMAVSRGLRVLKFFPAEAAGGIAFLKAVSGPYPEVRYVPTGGIGPSNLADYLALPTVFACGGSWMVRKDLIAAGDFDAIRRLAADAVALVRAARPKEAAVS
jgi:Entner-Doudoroff aldolase